MKRMRVLGTALLLFAAAAVMSAPPVQAASRQELERDATRALNSLYANNSAARLLGKKAKAILVFPTIVKAGFMFGGQIGEGVLLRRAARRSATTTRSRPRTACRPACRSSATRSSS